MAYIRGRLSSPLRYTFYSTVEKSNAAIDDAIYHSMHLPAFYKPVKLEVYKEKRTPIAKLRPESVKEKELIVNKWKKKDGPSPTTYRADESFDRTQGERLKAFKIVKETKIPSYTGKKTAFRPHLNRYCYKADKVRASPGSLQRGNESFGHDIEA